MSSAISAFLRDFFAPFCVFFRSFMAHVRPGTGLPAGNGVSGVP